MRTTITLDHDVAQRAKAVRARSGKTFKQVINDALRAGFERLDDAPKRSKPYRTKPKKMQLREGLHVDDVGGLIAQLEGETWR
jgi:hypothetical protein